MKTVLLAINAKYIHSSLAVWYLAAGVSWYAGTAHEIAVAECTIRQRDEEIASAVTGHSPDVVGISAYIWNAARLPCIIKLIKERLPEAVIVLGGPEASYNSGYWLANGADHVICGEGERSFPALLDKLAGAGAAACSGPDEWLNPYSEAYFNTLNGRLAYLETSRGCPFQCAYCLSGGSGTRFLPLNVAKERLQRLAQSGAKTIKLVDRTFNCDATRAFELFEFVIGLDTRCRFHFEVAADLFDERTLALLATAQPGRIQLEAGIQSFFEPALEASLRKMDLEKAEENIKAILDCGNIHLHVDLIAGLPYETLIEFERSFNRAYYLGAHTLQLGFLKLLHGSKMRERARDYGLVYSEDPPYEIMYSPWLSAEDLLIIRYAENALQHTYNKGRFLTATSYVLSVSGLEPFVLYRILGEAVPNRAVPLPDYAARLYDVMAGLPGVDAPVLRDHMLYDWLGMVKGVNTPSFLKRPRSFRQIAGRHHDIGRNEAAVLSSGRYIYVDRNERDPVTKLYKVHFS